MQKGSEELCRRRWQVVSSKSQVHLYTFIRKTNDVVGDDGADVGAMMGIAMVMAGVHPTSPGKFWDRSLWGPSQNQKTWISTGKSLAPAILWAPDFHFVLAMHHSHWICSKIRGLNQNFGTDLCGDLLKIALFSIFPKIDLPLLHFWYTFCTFFQNGPKIDIWKIMIFRAPLWPHFQFFWPIVKYKNLWGAKAPPSLAKLVVLRTTSLAKL